MAYPAYQLPAPADWQAFERFIHELFGSEWKDPRAQLNGRSGQPQAGVDVFGTNASTGGLEGVQCKGKDGRYGHSVGVDELTRGDHVLAVDDAPGEQPEGLQRFEGRRGQKVPRVASR